MVSILKTTETKCSAQRFWSDYRGECQWVHRFMATVVLGNETIDPLLFQVELELRHILSRKFQKCHHTILCFSFW